MASLTIFNVDELTGGGERALDSKSKSTLVDGCRALAVIDGRFRPFVYDANRTDTTQTTIFPALVRPYDYSSAGVWVEQLAGCPNENILINGGPLIWQRGESVTDPGISSEYATLDMWRARRSNASPLTIWRSISAPTRGRFSVCFTRPTGDTSTDVTRFAQEVESYRVYPLRGRFMTMSFWMSRNYTRISNEGGVVVRIESGTTADEPGVSLFLPPSGSHELYSDNLSLSGSDQNNKFYRYAFTTTSSVPADAGYLRVMIELKNIGTSAGTEEVRLSNLNLVAGEADTGYLQKPYDHDLAECQRYCWVGKIFQSYGFAYGSTGLLANIAGATFPVEMRTTPTMTIVTDPTYENCTNYDILADKTGFIHRGNVTSAGPFRGYGGKYLAEAQI